VAVEVVGRAVVEVERSLVVGTGVVTTLTTLGTSVVF
jgi:hypothetical protein